MPMTPSVAAVVAIRRKKQVRASAAVMFFIAVVFFAVSALEWVLLDPLPWYWRLAIIAFCWIGPIFLLLLKFSKFLLQERR